MNDKEITGFIDFFSNIHKLKSIKRSGWVRYKVKDPPSIASHIFSVSILSYLLPKDEKLDMEKVYKMALVHDLAEAVCGDLTPHDKEYKRKRHIETKALLEVVKNLPQEKRDEIMNLYNEMEDLKTPEAIFVETADKIDMVLTANEYSKTGLEVSEFLRVDHSQFTKSGKELVEYLKRCNNSE